MIKKRIKAANIMGNSARKSIESGVLLNSLVKNNRPSGIR
jgi:hypothetical protein